MTKLLQSILVLLIPLAAIANEQPSASSDAASSSQELGIPEPLIFDLVRPLGSPKGELEVNAFLNHTPGSGELQWSPEIEYSFADGYAVELELPYLNSQLQEYKLALQGTLGTLLEGKMVHGWQTIVRRARHEHAYSADALYLNGVRLSDKWSTMNMVGMRRTSFNGDGDLHGLVNSAWFYHASQKLVLGMELNNEFRPQRQWHYRLTPQLHYSFSDHRGIQLGVGPSRLADDRKSEWLSAIRFIYSF